MVQTKTNVINKYSLTYNYDNELNDAVMMNSRSELVITRKIRQ